MGPAGHSQALREGRASRLGHTASREDRDWSYQHTAEANSAKAIGKEGGDAVRGVHCSLHPPRSHLPVSLIPTHPQTPPTHPHSYAFPMQFPTPGIPSLCSESEHLRGSFLERMRCGASEALAGSQGRNSAAQLPLGAWGGGALKHLPTPLETLLSCQQPRRRPHLEATRPKQTGAN